MNFRKSFTIGMAALLFVPTSIFASVMEGNTAPSVESSEVVAAPAPAAVENKVTLSPSTPVATVKEVVKTIKTVKKSNAVEKTEGLPSDKNLKFAVLFAIIGLACLILAALIDGSGVIWTIGSILLLVALIFLILWAVNQ